MMEQIVNMIQDTLNDQQRAIEELNKKYLRVLCELEYLMNNISETCVEGNYNINKHVLESAKKSLQKSSPSHVPPYRRLPHGGAGVCESCAMPGE